ncbi:MAG TPA: hypothetical protein VH105_20035 [Burkholderiales bacterium]|nr:hypothetical protein [Burkholderiales bacterium]
MSDAPKSTSPDGRFAIYVDMWEAFNSHWVESPELTDTRSGATLLKFNNDNWSLDAAQWQSDTVVSLSLRKYPGDHTPSAFEVVVDCEQGNASVADMAPLPLAEVEEALERLYLAGRRQG